MDIGVKQMIAPIRFLFIIQPDNEDRFRRATELAYMLWGGIYAPILPCYKKLPQEYRVEFNIDIPTLDYYKNTIENFDPDVVLYDEDLDKDFISSIVGEIEAVRIDQYLKDISDGHYDHSISILEVAEHLAAKEFKFIRSDNLKLTIPKIAGNDLLLQTFIGKIPDFFEKSICDLFSGNGAFEQPEVDWKTMDTYQAYPRIDLLELNNYKIESWVNKSYKRGSCLYFLRSDRLQDVINFWNLRAAGWLIIPIPVNMVELPYFAGVAKRFVDAMIRQPNSNHAWITQLIGYQLSEDVIHKAVNHVKPDVTKYQKQIIFSFQQWFPRFWADYEILDADHVKSHIPIYDTFFDHYKMEGDRLKFSPKQLPFEANWNLSRESAYKVIITLSVYDEYTDYAELLTGISGIQLRQLTYPMDFRKWRLSPAGMHRTINRSDDEVNINIPKSLDFFKFFFANKAHKLAETANSKLAKEVLRNIGGLHGSKLFLRTGPLQIIELFGGGRQISYVGLLAEIKKKIGLKNKAAKIFIASLLERKVIEMGAVIQCRVCEQHGFFLPNQVDEKIICPICRNQYSLPMDEPSQIVWSYRGIGPFSRNNKADGVMAVFAALCLFHDEFADMQGKISALIGFELVKIGKTPEQYPKEVDLGLVLENRYDTDKRPDLLFCECKTYKRFTEEDVARMKILGDQFPGAILTTATLNESLSNEEVILIGSLVQYFQRGYLQRPQNPVLILTGKELLPEEYRGAFNVYKDQIRPYHRYNDFIGALCELTVKKHLKVPNWWELRERVRIQEFERRKQIGQIIESLRRRVEDVKK